MSMIALRDLIRFLGPKWLTRDRSVGPASAKVETDSRALYTLGLYYDATYDRIKLGIEQRFAGGGAALDALAYLGRDRQIFRGPSQSRASWELQIQRAWDDAQLWGMAFALLEQLRAFLSPNALDLATVDNHGNWYLIAGDGTRARVKGSEWDWDDEPATEWGRFWTIVYMPDGIPFEPSPPWGDPELWGGAWGTPGYTWGSTATVDDITGLQRLTRSRRPAGTTCIHIIVVFDASSGAFDPNGTAPPMPDGTWGHWSKNVGGVQVPARDPGAIYIDG